MLRMMSVFLLSGILIASIFANENQNELNKPLKEGEKIRVVGDHHLLFSISEDWKTLHLKVVSDKGEPVAIGDNSIEVFVRPSNRRSPFKLTMYAHSPDHQGTNVSSHYVGELEFVDHFDSFKVNTYVAINGKRCVSEFSFKR